MREARYKQLKQRGLRVHSVHGDFRVTPKVTQSIESIDNPDLVLLTVNTYHLPDLMDAIALLATKGARVLPLLNGIGHMDVLRHTLPLGIVWGGVSYIESTLDEDGDIRQTSPMQEIRMGALSSGESQLLATAYDAFLKANITTTIEDQIETIMWQKYLFLLTLCSVTASLCRPIGIALADTG